MIRRALWTLLMSMLENWRSESEGERRCKAALAAGEEALRERFHRGAMR